MNYGTLRFTNDTYRSSLWRMDSRIKATEKFVDDLNFASGPERARVATGVITSVLLPGKVIKGVQAIRNKIILGNSGPPMFKPRLNREPRTSDISFLSVSDIRTGQYANYNGPLLYIIDNNRQLKILPNKLTIPESANTTTGKWLTFDQIKINHNDFGRKPFVYAAGEIIIDNGKIVGINNISGTYCPIEVVKFQGGLHELSTIQRHVIGKYFPEVKESGFPFNRSLYNDIRKPSDIEHFYKPPLIQTILKEGALAQSGLATYQNRDGQHSDSGLFPSAYGAAITTQNNNNTNSFLRNPFFFNQPFMTQPWNNAIQPWHTMLPSWNNLYNQKPTMFEMQMKIGQLVSFFPQSELSIKSSFEMAFGGKVTSSDFYSALSSCPSVVNFRGYLCSSTALSNLSLSSFGCLLGSTSLRSTYNSFNSLYYNLLMHNLGFIGGVAAKVGVIKAPFIDDVNIIAFKSEDGKQPFSDQQLKQICAELKGAIFTYNTFPFFSLHFNDKGQLYPVIHPAYNGTEVGKVIGFLDYLMKCYLNGAGYSEDLNAMIFTSSINGALITPTLAEMAR